MVSPKIRRRIRAALFLSLASVWVLGLPGGEATAVNIKWFSHSNSSCTTKVDPVSMLFIYNGYEYNTGNHISYHAAWGDTTLDGSDQYFWTAGYCDSQAGNSRADASALASQRHHIRWVQSREYSWEYETYSIGTPHHEHRVTCGGSWKHAVDPTSNGWSGFDMGRHQLYGLMQAAHANWTEYVGNTQQMPQCNGWMSGSNGYIRVIVLPSTTH